MCVSALAILVSPIAWEHYWVGFFPVFVLLLVQAWRSGPSWHSRWAHASFWIGFVCFTVLSRPIVGWSGARTVRAWSLMTWGGVVMCAVCAAILAWRTNALPHSAAPVEDSETVSAQEPAEDI